MAPSPSPRIDKAVSVGWIPPATSVALNRPRGNSIKQIPSDIRPPAHRLFAPALISTQLNELRRQCSYLGIRRSPSRATPDSLTGDSEAPPTADPGNGRILQPESAN